MLVALKPLGFVLATGLLRLFQKLLRLFLNAFAFAWHPTG
jgi:hypothetical protein